MTQKVQIKATKKGVVARKTAKKNNGQFFKPNQSRKTLKWIE